MDSFGRKNICDRIVADEIRSENIPTDFLTDFSVTKGVKCGKKPKPAVCDRKFPTEFDQKSKFPIEFGWKFGHNGLPQTKTQNHGSLVTNWTTNINDQKYGYYS